MVQSFYGGSIRPSDSSTRLDSSLARVSAPGDVTVPSVASHTHSAISCADAAAGRPPDPWGLYSVNVVNRAEGRPLEVAQQPAVEAIPRFQSPPSLLHEGVNSLIGKAGTYVDASFCRGAYSAEILRRLPAGSSLIVRVDTSVDESAAKAMAQADSRVSAVLRAPLGELGAALAGRQVAGVLVDFGQAWQQSDEVFRGLSSIDDTPLDMRLDPSRGVSVSEWLQTATTSELAWVIHAYGEDDDPMTALRIAEAVMDRQRRQGPYHNAYQLVEVIKRANPSADNRTLHPAKLTLIALRTFINGEFEQLQDLLEGVLPLLTLGGRIVAVSSRKSESALIKTFLRQHEDSHPVLEAFSSPQRLQDLYPLLRSPKPFAVVQACAPIWPEKRGEGRGVRSLAAHVLQKVARTSSAPQHHLLQHDDRGSCTDLFVRPRQLQFKGG